VLSATHQPSPLSGMGALPLSAEAVFGSGNGIAVSADGRWQMADGRWQMADGRWRRVLRHNHPCAPGLLTF